MDFRLFITPIAQLHIQEAYDYYFDKVSIAIADKFFLDLQQTYKALSINPFYQIRTKSYRAIPLKHFPYLLFFEVQEEKQLVKVLALFHTSQNPTKWP